MDIPAILNRSCSNMTQFLTWPEPFKNSAALQQSRFLGLQVTQSMCRHIGHAPAIQLLCCLTRRLNLRVFLQPHRTAAGQSVIWVWGLQRGGCMASLVLAPAVKIWCASQKQDMPLKRDWRNLCYFMQRKAPCVPQSMPENRKGP